MGTIGYSYDSPGTVSAVFFSKKDAEKAYAGLLRLGHSEDDIALLMSDETLNNHANPSSENNAFDADTVISETDDHPKGARQFIANAILSITSMVSLPELGISISRRLVGEPIGNSLKSIIGTKIPQEHCDTYETGIKEGGIIISVDPKNLAERDAIIREFRISEGHDILGDDGYTELD